MFFIFLLWREKNYLIKNVLYMDPPKYLIINPLFVKFYKKNDKVIQHMERNFYLFFNAQKISNLIKNLKNPKVHKLY